MSDEMTHDAAREALEALALDALDASEREAVMAHVATCAECQSELAALENTEGEIALAAAPIAMRPGQRERIRARLVARAAADRGASGTLPLRVESARTEREHVVRRADVTPIGTAPSARRGRSVSGWAAIAASVIAVVGIGSYLNARAERDSLRDTIRQVAVESRARTAAMDSLRASLEDKDRMIANLTGAQVAVMTLASVGPQSPTGRMFWDQAHNAWTFVAHNVPMPKSGRTYQMWLVTPTTKISAGTFMPSPGGDVMMQASYALPKDSLAAVAVTDEPMGGSPQPTTQPLMVASK
jgi:anti-sigma-K factor RskA